MMSSSGAAVGFPGAKADSTGVIRSGSLVGDGSCDGIGVTVGGVVGAGAQAFMISKEEKIKVGAKNNFFMQTPQMQGAESAGRGAAFRFTLPRAS